MKKTRTLSFSWLMMCMCALAMCVTSCESNNDDSIPNPNNPAIALTGVWEAKSLSPYDGTEQTLYYIFTSDGKAAIFTLAEEHIYRVYATYDYTYKPAEKRVLFKSGKGESSYGTHLEGNTLTMFGLFYGGSNVHYGTRIKSDITYADIERHVEESKPDKMPEGLTGFWEVLSWNTDMPLCFIPEEAHYYFGEDGKMIVYFEDDVDGVPTLRGAYTGTYSYEVKTETKDYGDHLFEYQAQIFHMHYMNKDFSHQISVGKGEFSFTKSPFAYVFRKVDGHFTYDQLMDYANAHPVEMQDDL